MSICHLRPNIFMYSCMYLRASACCRLDRKWPCINSCLIMCYLPQVNGSFDGDYADLDRATGTGKLQQRRPGKSTITGKHIVNSCWSLFPRCSHNSAPVLLAVKSLMILFTLAKSLLLGVCVFASEHLQACNNIASKNGMLLVSSYTPHAIKSYIHFLLWHFRNRNSNGDKNVYVLETKWG